MPLNAMLANNFKLNIILKYLQKNYATIKFFIITFTSLVVAYYVPEEI